jgi:hypothetical protein
MVQGDLAMNWTSSSLLSENSTGVNFNPPHTPYQSGSDDDYFDQYTGQITGLVYATGQFTQSNRSSIDGVLVVGGGASITGQMTFVYDSTYYSDAPPGFSAGNDMEVVPGTWKQVAY